jgi:hypothetical protein
LGSPRMAKPWWASKSVRGGVRGEKKRRERRTDVLVLRVVLGDLLGDLLLLDGEHAVASNDREGRKSKKGQ